MSKKERVISTEVKEYFQLNNAASTWWKPEGIPRYNRQIKLINHSLQIKDKVILDVATGTGRFAINFAKRNAKRVIAIDISAKMVEIAKHNAHKNNAAVTILFVVCDVDNFECKDGLFDVINVMELLVHLPKPQLTLKKLSRYLKPGGILITNVDLPTINNTVYRQIFYLRKDLYLTIPRWLRENLFHRYFGLPIDTEKRQILETTEEIREKIKSDSNIRLTKRKDPYCAIDCQ